MKGKNYIRHSVDHPDPLEATEFKMQKLSFMTRSGSQVLINSYWIYGDSAILTMQIVVVNSAGHGANNW
jgi:hypothetical protein